MPTVSLLAKDSKRKRRELEPLKSELASVIRTWIADNSIGPNEPLFVLDTPSGYPRKTAKMSVVTSNSPEENGSTRPKMTRSGPLAGSRRTSCATVTPTGCLRTFTPTVTHSFPISPTTVCRSSSPRSWPGTTTPS